MSRQQSTSAAPEWAPADHDTRYSEACIEDPSQRPYWYFGRGLGPARHPLAEQIPFQLLACGHCGGRYPWFDVVAAHHAEGPKRGEESWSTEFRCVLCRQYTRVSSSAA
jgi:hypothetical protein